MVNPNSYSNSITKPIWNKVRALSPWIPKVVIWAHRRVGDPQIKREIGHNLLTRLLSKFCFARIARCSSPTNQSSTIQITNCWAGSWIQCKNWSKLIHGSTGLTSLTGPSWRNWISKINCHWKGWENCSVAKSNQAAWQSSSWFDQ